jgi:transcriptional regulator with XRE-family HTH domain
MSPSSDTVCAMPPEEIDALMAELYHWCKQERGRQKDLAERLGVTEQTLSNWIARRKTPSLEKYLFLRAFLKKQRRAKSRGQR